MAQVFEPRQLTRRGLVLTPMTPLGTTGLDDLRSQISGDVLGDDLGRVIYSSAAGIYQVLPLGVVRPRHSEDIAQTLRWCEPEGVPVTVRGGGTSPTGACLGTGLIIDTSTYMGAETEFDVGEDTVTVPPGANYAKINQVLAQFNRYLPPDPSAGDYCTIGGLIGTNSSGIPSAK